MDPEDDDLEWSFDADGDGSDEEDGNGGDLPGQATWAYAGPGTYTATFTVQDEEGNVVFRTLAITVA